MPAAAVALAQGTVRQGRQCRVLGKGLRTRLNQSSRLMTEEHGRGATLDQGTVYAHNRGARAVAGGGGSGWGGSEGAVRRRRKQMVAATAVVARLLEAQGSAGGGE